MDEFGIIKKYFASKAKSFGDHVVLGPGDDCAILDLPKGSEMCVSTDTLVEGVHFPVNADPALVASRLMAANLSDLAAMGADVHSFTLAVTSPTFTESWLNGFSKRLFEICECQQISLVGGNLSKGQLALTITIMGMVKKGTAILRCGAQLGDDIYVSGYLGDAAAGLALVINGELKDDAQLIAAYADPSARLKLGQQLRGIANAAIDISDGFAADLAHLCEASQKAATVDLGKLPISKAAIDRFGIVEAQKFAVQGGDDYELCFTVPQNMSDEIKKIADNQQLRLTKVGVIQAGEGVKLIAANGEAYTAAEGYRHF